MPTGSISNALLLRQIGITVPDSDYTYYFAPSMPQYAVGQSSTLLATPNGATFRGHNTSTFRGHNDVPGTQYLIRRAVCVV